MTAALNPGDHLRGGDVTCSKRHFVLSSQYWDTRDKGAIELLAPLTLFTAPKLLRGVQVLWNLGASAWRCRCWNLVARLELCWRVDRCLAARGALHGSCEDVRVYCAIP